MIFFGEKIRQKTPMSRGELSNLALFRFPNMDFGLIFQRVFSDRKLLEKKNRGITKA